MTSISKIVQDRGITEVVHFTTDVGLLGTLAMGQLLPRAGVEDEQYLEHILQVNAPVRKDPRWTGYSSLSISRANWRYFEYSERSHETDGLLWGVLVFDPAVLAHDGVTFVTTNNIYPAARRATGPGGLEALFADAVGRDYQRLSTRTGLADRDTTDVQAEVLYPGRLSTEHLLRVVVEDGDHIDLVRGQIAAVGHRDVDVVLDTSLRSARL